MIQPSRNMALFARALAYRAAIGSLLAVVALGMVVLKDVPEPKVARVDTKKLASL